MLTVAWVARAAPGYEPPVYDPRPTTGYDSHLNTGRDPHPIPSTGYDQPVEPCRNGAVLRADGVCQQPINIKKVFVFTAPQAPRTYRPPPPLPKPRVLTNVLFIRTPAPEEAPEPYVVPPPREKNIIYVLDQKRDQDQRLIEVPSPPQEKPEVYFVHFKDGENPILPDGTDLNSALQAAGVDQDLTGVSAQIGGNEGIAGIGGIGDIGGVGSVSIGGVGGYGGNNVPDITLAGGVGGGYGGNAGHDVDSGYGGKLDIHPY